MSELIFYTNPMSRGRIVRWMLEEIGCDYQTEVIKHGPAMKSPGFLAINPMGKVPALSHFGKVITETPAILAYLADAFPEAELAPPPAERQAYYRWLFFAAGPLEAAVTNKHFKFELPDDPRASGMAGYGSYDLTVNLL
jgi:glutathione S-transferase